MARKRRTGGGKPFGRSPDEAPDARTKYTANETFDDSEDDFHAGRDKVLLEERPDVKRRRRLDENNDFLQHSDEEVLGYEEPDDEELEDDDDDETGDDIDEALAAEDGGEETDERLGDFGRSTSDYYDADVIQTEEDALEEEREARRIQQKQLEGMTEADFGFDESQWLDEEEAATAGNKTVTEKLPEPMIDEKMSAEERLKMLKSRYPEFEHLAKDFVDLQQSHEDLRLAASAAEAVTNHVASQSRKRKLDEVDGEPRLIPLAITKFRALSAYLGTVGMYFTLLTTSTSSKSGLGIPPAKLREHPIINSLVQCRQLWTAIKDVPIPPIEEAPVHEVSNTTVNDTLSTVQPTQKKKQKKRKSRAERAAIAADLADIEAREARLAAAEASLADLDGLIAPRSKKPAKTTIVDQPLEADSDFGDETPLTAEEAAAKAQRKKSLRFYTSQIAQKANKRGAATRDGGGDTDIPHKERIRDRQERLNREAAKRGNAGPDLQDDQSSDEGPTNAEREAADSDEEYYQTITSRNAAKKATRSALASAHAAAASQNGSLTNVQLSNQIAADGKRGITYEIKKNKGLTPHRKKDVRNPRVRKKQKYEEKMKKLRGSGQRQVWKGGEGRGGYGGESTGINRNVVRSVKL